MKAMLDLPGQAPKRLWDAPPWAVMGGPAFINEAEGPEDDISFSRL